MTTEQAPRELTDAQIKKMASKFGVGNKPSPNFDFAWHDFARAAIAADRALVASQAQPAAEPVAYLHLSEYGHVYAVAHHAALSRIGLDMTKPLPLFLAATQQPTEPRQDSVHAVESGGTTLPLSPRALADYVSKAVAENDGEPHSADEIWAIVIEACAETHRLEHPEMHP